MDNLVDKKRSLATMQAKGDGLYLKRRGKSASWIFRVQVAGKRSDGSLGTEAEFNLREAKEMARDMHRAIAHGQKSG